MKKKIQLRKSSKGTNRKSFTAVFARIDFSCKQKINRKQAGRTRLKINVI